MACTHKRIITRYTTERSSPVTKSDKLDRKSFIVQPLDTAFTLDVLFPGGKWDAEGNDIPGVELVDAGGGDKGTAKTDVRYAAGICFILVGKNNFCGILFSFMDSLKSQVISHGGDQVLPGKTGLM